MDRHRKWGHCRFNLRVTAARRSWLAASAGSCCRKPPRRPPSNSARKLALREIGGGAPPRPQTSGPERFRNFMLQEEFDAFEDCLSSCSFIPFLTARSHIVEIVAAKDVIFVLTCSGLCAAFSRKTNKHICFLNIDPDEAVRSLFYNKNNDSLITVSAYSEDHYSSLKCRSTPIEYIRRKQIDAGFPLFETESLKWPGFVEFDDVNGKVLTFSAHDRSYKVFDLKTYNYLYAICDNNIQEIKISPGILLLIYQRTPSYVPLKILSIEDGQELKSFKHLLHRNKKIDFIEQFNEKLLVKQDDENLQIIDIRSEDMVEVNKNEFKTPSAFIFLYENHLFLTFRNRMVAVWNYHGELITSFDDHILSQHCCNTNNIYITSEQDVIISYCKAGDGSGSAPKRSDNLEDDEDDDDSSVGSINISNILTGKCVSKISSLDPAIRVAPRRKNDPTRSKVRSTIKDSLNDVTALFYDEDRNEIYTGNSQGMVHIWTN